MEDYYEFIDNFGTHYVSELRMGAKFGYYSVFDRSSYEKLRSEGVSVELAASASYGGVTGGGSVGTTVSKESIDKFNSARSSVKSFSIGSRPADDAGTWARQAFTSPMPVTYTLLPLDSLVGKVYGASNPRVVAKLAEALKTYCSYLLRKGQIPDCSAPTDYVAGTRPNSCRLCA
jgi:MAC/Perforin domain